MGRTVEGLEQSAEKIADAQPLEAGKKQTLEIELKLNTENLRARRPHSLEIVSKDDPKVKAEVAVEFKK